MPNSPILDKSVQWRINTGRIESQEPRHADVVEAILSSGLATEVVRLLSGGKEADVYLARYGSGPLVVKVYRLYRTSHRGGRPVRADVLGWRAAHEYEMLHQAWKGGIRVPTPARREEQMLSMRYLGTEEGPAPRLHDVVLEEPAALLEEILTATEAMARAGVVHGDFSAYNILLHEGHPWFIDFSEAFRVDRNRGAPRQRLDEASAFLTHGLEALGRYFRRYGLTIDVEPFVERVVHALDRFGLLS